MAKPNSEREFQNFIKDTLKQQGCWSSQLHPGLGSDVGIPDLLTACDSVGIVPIELKIGTVENNTIVWSSTVRPSQVAWHYKVTSHGWPSAVLIGVPVGKSWDVYIVEGSKANMVRDGLHIGKDTHKLDTRVFADSLSSWAEDIYNYSDE
jgi:hypothetical protein